MKKDTNPAIGISVATLLTEGAKLVDRLLNAYQRKKELDLEILKECTKNEQELKRIENTRIELIHVHKENMKKIDELGEMLKAELMNNAASRQVFIHQSSVCLDMQRKLGEAAIMENDKDRRKELFNESIQYGKLLQIACDNFQKESTKRYVEGPAILRSIPLNGDSVKMIGEK